MEKQTFKDREKGAYQRLLQYELQQYAQEHTRETLGTPYGRAPPIKLYNLQEGSLSNRSADTTPIKDLSLYKHTLESSTSNEISPRTFSSVERLLSRTLRTPRLDPLLQSSFSAGTLSYRSGPLPQFPATQKPLSYSFHPSDILRKDSEYQFKTAIPEEIETFNPFQRPQADDYFFPPDMFLDEDLTQVISELPTEGLGKWRHNDGSCEWKACHILSYYPETRIFEIQWSDSFARKGVTRLNLRFQGETEPEFDARCRKVKEMRMIHEGFVRYFGRFELALANTFLGKNGNFLSGEAAILQKISYPFRSVEEEESVKREIWEMYRRGVWKFIFDSQYFYEKVRLAACPWKDDLDRQIRWTEKLTYEAAEQPFDQQRKKVQEKYMNPRKLLDQSRLNIYKSLTMIRKGDYYRHLRGLQGLGYTLNTLNYKFKDCFSVDLMKIDTVIKQIREFLLKTWEENKSQESKKMIELSDDVDQYFHTSQIILESNLQYAIAHSVQTLINIFSDYYPMVPLPGDLANQMKNLPEYIRIRHEGKKPETPHNPMSQIQSTKMMREVIEILDTDFKDGKLYRYLMDKRIPPLVSLSIDSKISKFRHPKCFEIRLGMPDREWRRSKVLGIPPTSMIVIHESAHHHHIHSLMQREDECSLAAEQDPALQYESIIPNSLLKEELFGWASSGQDRLNIELNPTLETIDENLRTLAKAPLKNLQLIKMLKRDSIGVGKLRAGNAKNALNSALKELSIVFQYSLYGPMALLAILRHFEYLFTPDPNSLYEKIIASHVDDYAGFVQEIETIEKHKEMLEYKLPKALQFGIFEVDLTELKAEGIRNAEALMDSLLEELMCEHLGILREVHASYDSLLSVLSRSPESVEDLGYLQDFLTEKKDEEVAAHISKELESVQFISDSLERFQKSMGDEQSVLWWKTKSWGLTTKREKTRLQKRLQKMIPSLQEEVQRHISEMKAMVTGLKTDVADFINYNDVQKADIYAGKASDIIQLLNKLKSGITLASSREKRLGYALTNFSDVFALEEQFMSFNEFWTFASEWAFSYMSWMEKPLHFIDPVAVLRKFNRGKQLLQTLGGELYGNPNVIQAIEDLKEQLRSFENTVPLISYLREESLRDRHWKKIWDTLGRVASDKPDSERKDSQTLRELLLQGVLRHGKTIEAIAYEAKKESEIEQRCAKIDKEIRSPTIEIVSHPKHEDLRILARLEEMRDTLHEYATTITFLDSASHYVEPFKDVMKYLISAISTQRTMLDDIYEFQSVLIELFPVLKIREMCEQLPRTTEQMRVLVMYYARQLKFMQDVRDRQTHNFATNNEGAVKSLSDASAQLKAIKEDVQKKLTEKQSQYSRLFFLSDIEILTLMSRVRPKGTIEVSALFPGIEEVRLGQKHIRGVVRDGNVLELNTSVVVIQESGSPRNIDEWLADLDSGLKDLHSKRILSLFTQFSSSRLPWDSEKDSEAVYIAYLAWFSHEMQGIFQGDSVLAGLTDMLDVLKTALAIGIDAMTPSHGTPGHGNLLNAVMNQFNKSPESAGQRQSNEMLVHLLISHIDILKRLQNSAEIDIPLQWKSVFKLTPTVTSTDSTESLSLNVDCFDYVTSFGFEMHSLNYLQSFILMPASEKRLLHLYLTLKHGLGGMLAGPPGSEKTETLKHLAVVCGRLLQMCYITSTTSFDKVIKFVVGCALGGSWGCMDEIRSLPEIYLCTVTHYIKTVLSAPAQSRVTIDCYQMKPKPGFTMFCTSSASNLQLPRTFHELFRVLSVTKPDLSTIATILMTTYGFQDAERYGRMIAKAMDFLQQPLVSLATASTLELRIKANTKTLIRLVRVMISIAQIHYISDMPYLINNSFRQVYGLGLLPRDLETLDEYLSTLFQAAHNDILAQISHRSVSDEILQVLTEEKVVAMEAIQRRCQHLWWLLYEAKRPWVFVVGKPLSGKSEVIRLLSKVAVSVLKFNFQIHTLGAAAPPELLSSLHEYLTTCSNPWFSSDPPTSFSSNSVLPGDKVVGCSPKDWIRIDSYSLPYTTDALLSATRDYLSSDLKLIMEVESLAVADPAVVSEAGILYVEDTDIDLDGFYQICMRKIMPKDLEEHFQTLEKLFHLLLVPVIAYLDTAEVTLRLPQKLEIQQFSNLLKPYLKMLSRKMKKEAEKEILPLSKGQNPLFLVRRASTFKHQQEEKPQRHNTILTSMHSIKSNVLKYLGAVRKSVAQLKPQLCLEAIYIVTVVNSLGNLVVNKDGFANMISHILANQPDDFAYFLSKELTERGSNSISDLVFSMKTFSWYRFLSSPGNGGKSYIEKSAHSHRRDLSFYGTTSERLNILSINQSRFNMLIGTESTRRLAHWVEFCLHSGTDFLVFGPHESGKSSVTLAVAKNFLSHSSCGLVPFNVSEFTTAYAVQDSVQSAMEHCRKNAYGGLGGKRYFAVLDDMNMDSSNQLYELFRFWKENRGWYSEGFVTVSDLTLALVHSYTEGASPPLWFRAIRHFFLLHKAAYTQVEITSIFRKHVDPGAAEEPPPTSDMLSVPEESVLALASLFLQLQHQQKKSEKLWCHISISNFTLALKFFAQFELSDAIDIPTYLKLWSFMYSRFFTDQLGNVSELNEEIRSIVTENLQNLIYKFVDDDEVIEQILQEGFIIPSREEIKNVSTENFKDVGAVDTESIAYVVSQFHASHESCVRLYPHLLKYLHALIVNIEYRFSVFYYFYLTLLYDIKSSCPSVIIKSDAQVLLIKALVYIAAETLKMKVFEIGAGEWEDGFSEHVIDSFRQVSPHHIPTEIRFAIKHIVEEAMILNKRTLIVVSLKTEKQLDSPISRRIMEITNDIITGVQLRLTGFSIYYSEFVDSFRNQTLDPSVKKQHYNDEILQMMLDRMRLNTTIVFLVNSKAGSWIRSPLHPIGILEKIKHEYRSIFNRSRIVDFDNLVPPQAFVSYIQRNPGVLETWKLSFHNVLLEDIGDKVTKIAKINGLDEYAYECIIYCSAKLLKDLRTHKSVMKSTFSRAIRQIEILKDSVSSSEQKILTLESEAKRLESRLEKLKKKLASAETEFAEKSNQDFPAIFTTLIQAQRTEFSAVFAAARSAWEHTIEEFVYKTEDVRDMEKTLSTPMIVRLMYLLHVLINQADTAEAPDDMMESAVRKLTPQLSKKVKEINKKLKKMEAETIPDLNAGLREIELGGRLPKLVKATYGVILAAQTLREARMKLGEQETELDERLERVPEDVETKLKELRENQTVQVAKIQGKINKLQGRLTQIFLDIEQIGISKPKLTKLIQDLRGNSEAWSSALAGTEEEESDLGDSVLSSFMLLKGMSLPYDTRCLMVQNIMETMRKHGYSCHPQTSLTFRLIENHRSFDYLCFRSNLPDSAFFKDNAAAIQTVFRLNLPFPGIYDPYEIAVAFIGKLEAENGLLVGKVTNDTAFERKLREAIVEGRPVLCIDPSSSLARALIPILAWKAQMFLSQMRGMDVGLLRLPTSKTDLKVHPKFKLFVCFKTLPSTEIQQMMTIINFDAVDKDSWETFVFLPLLKLLDEHQHQVYNYQVLKQQEQTLAMEDAEMEILNLLTQNDMDEVLRSATLLDRLTRAWRKMRLLPMEEEPGNRRRSSVFAINKERPEMMENRILPVLVVEPKVSPKEKLKNLLAEMFDFKEVLYMCNPGLKDYAVSGKLLHMMIMNSVLEYIRTIAVPLESQWDAFAECMTYRVFVRISHSLPTDKRLLFTSFYTFYKHYKTNPIPRKEYLQIMDDVAKVVEHPKSQSENLDYLQMRYPHLFPAYFAPGVASFSLFITRDLFKDAKLPDAFPAIHRYLLYAYLRPDLLPDFISHLTEDVLGSRFNWVPRIDFDIYFSDSVKLPTVVFFQETSPIAMLRYMAEARNVMLVPTQPLHASIVKTSRQEIRHSGRLTEPVISALTENLNSSRWLTIENLQTVTGLEAEVLTKFLIYKVAEEASDNLRIWILLQGHPEEYPQWGNLVKQCQRIVIPEPSTLKEQMLLWHYTNKSAFFIHYRNHVSARYYEHCSLEGGILERGLERKVSKKSASMVALQEAAEESKRRDNGVDSKETLAFNAALFFSILYLRALYHSDLSDLWKRADARMLLDEFLSYLPPKTYPEDLLRPSLLSFFCTLLIPQLEKHPAATVISLMRQVFTIEKSVLEVKSQDKNQPFSTIEYPLFQLEHLDPNQNLEILINRFPVEDHIQVTGLRHHQTVPSRIQEAKVLLEVLTTLHHSLEGELQLDYSTYLVTEKKAVSDGLQRFLNELLDAIPSVVESRILSEQRLYTNIFLKPEQTHQTVLAVTKDGFKLSDMRNSVLDSPPRLEEVMEVLELTEEKLCRDFLANVRRPLMEMNLYLSYSRPTLSKADMKDLVDLANDRVPTHWLDLSPYVTRLVRNADGWKKELILRFHKHVLWTEIDLSLLFAPSLVLQTILRAASIATGQHFEKMCFEIAFGDATTCDSRRFQIAIRGLYITNARINREMGVLEDHELGEELPTLVLTPATEPESIRDYQEYPEGLKLIWNNDNSRVSSPESDTSFIGEETPGEMTWSGEGKPLVFFPVMIASSVLWMLVSAKKPQGHWSKRGVLVQLGESAYA